MNQVSELRGELQVAQAELEAHQNKYYWVKGYGTGYLGQHYGLTDEQYDWTFAHNTVLRGRVLRIMRDIERRKKPGRMRPSMAGLT